MRAFFPGTEDEEEELVEFVFKRRRLRRAQLPTFNVQLPTLNRARRVGTRALQKTS